VATASSNYHITRRAPTIVVAVADLIGVHGAVSIEIISTGIQQVDTCTPVHKRAVGVSGLTNELPLTPCGHVAVVYVGEVLKNRAAIVGGSVSLLTTIS
jgi:hypothetical protein